MELNYWNNVKLELKRQNKKQSELADYICLVVGTLKTKMATNTLPTFETAIKISEFLNCSMEYLLYGSESNEFSSEEISLINDFRTLTPAQQKIIKMLLDNFNGVSSEITPNGDNFIIVK